MAQLIVRFVGAFLLHIDNSNFGRVYLRSNSAGSGTTHVPKITFPMAYADNSFLPDDELLLTLDGERLVRRKLPCNKRYKFALNGNTSPFSKATGVPTNPTDNPPSVDEGLSPDYLPTLASGDAKGLKTHDELLALSFTHIELGNLGIFSTERAVRQPNKELIEWEFVADNLESANPPQAQIIADIFRWTTDFGDTTLMLAEKPETPNAFNTHLHLSVPSTQSVEIIISNLEEQPIMGNSDTLTEFKSLLDYGTGVVVPRVPKKGPNVTANSVTCPASRWP